MRLQTALRSIFVARNFYSWYEPKISYTHSRPVQTFKESTGILISTLTCVTITFFAICSTLPAPIGLSPCYVEERTKDVQEIFL